MNKVIVGIIIFIILFFSGIIWYEKQPGKLDTFALCLSDNNAQFYGAFWCSHCHKQKALFGKSKKHLPYIECSTPDGRGTTQPCIEANISGYPTWEFADGERISGQISLATLAEKTGCVLP